MKKFATATVLIAVMAGSASCKKEIIGHGPITTESRNVRPFTGIELRMNGNVYYKNDTVWKLEVTAKESIHDILETIVVNNKLVIRYTNGKTYDEDESIRINISGPGINRFELNSSGSIYCINTIDQPDLYLRSAGSGNIFLQHILSNNVEAASSVSGRITTAGGSSVNATATTDGSGSIDLSATNVKNATSRITGSGDIELKVADWLVARIDGSGSVYYTGYPFVISDISGTGRIIHF